MLRTYILAALAAVIALAPLSRAEEQPPRERARQLLADGNYREAEEIFRALALGPDAHPREAAENFKDAFSCRLALSGNPEEFLPFLAEAVAAHPGSWRIPAEAAVILIGESREITIPLGDETRVIPLLAHVPFGEHHRMQALMLFLAAGQHLDDAGDPATEEDKLAFYGMFEKAVQTGRMYGDAWRLGSLTDLSRPYEADLPAIQASFRARMFTPRGAPVDENGDPIYYRIPASWDAAKNDGERWRWILSRMAAVNETGQATADRLLAEFLVTQFGVQTMKQRQDAREMDLAGESGPFAVRTLRDDETIANLATGLKRFTMPPEFDHIRLFRKVAEAGDRTLRDQALATLAAIFENRQQYPRAVEIWRNLIETEADAEILKTAKEELKNITAATGALEPTTERGTLAYLFRNGRRVSFTAKRLDEKQLLADIRSELKSADGDFRRDYFHSRPEALGRFVLDERGEKYLGATAAEWTIDLDPLPDHFSRRIDVPVPMTDAGCYLVEATMENGNTSRAVLWLADLALVKKDALSEQLLFVADAATGEPVADATVSFLGLEQHWNEQRREPDYTVHEFADRTDADGLLFVPSGKMNHREWLITATAPDGRFAYTGFEPVWMSQPQTDSPQQTTAFLLTDRPAYRPGQTVQFKAWIGRASYAPRPGDSFAGRKAQLTIHNPRGDVVYDKTLAADEYGGMADSFTPEDETPLGHYYINLRADDTAGGIGFRVEEYKKPEFEITLQTPDTALELGDSVQLKVNAAYYYGSPVTDAKVTYKILRSARTDAWVPLWRWDWLYGPGAWIRPEPRPEPSPRMWFRPEQPELVAEGEGALDADGAFRLTLDTAPAKELFGDQDHEYEITFEVTDKSRRTISGGGRVVAAREPFAVAVWTERGYYRPGEEIKIEANARLPLGGGVAATGTAILFRQETEIDRFDIATDADGGASLRFRAPEAGMYRLALRLKNADGKTVEASAALTVRGGTGEGDFRFPPLELVPDKRDYAPGETLRLAVNSENPDGFILLIPRAERGGRPRLVRLKNGTHFADIKIGRADQPNFFCEALTVFGGKVHSETREIFVPPADKTLHVTVTSDKENYLPGEEAAFTLAVTGADGEPVAAQCAVSLYDKSVEYVSGGANTGDIRAAFWSWKRYHNTNLTSSLAKSPYTVERDGDLPWRPIGIFGGEEADWNNGELYTNARAVPAPAMGAPDMIMQAESAVAMDAAAPMMAKATAAYAGGAAEMAEPTVRSDFADTAFWTAALETDADGRATFTAKMPENLTAWKARVRVMGAETRVGEAEAEVATRKNVIIRPQAPRFLTQKDQVILSANLHNYLPRAKSARAELLLDGTLLEPANGAALVHEINLAANGEARVDWPVAAKRPGTATVTMKLLTDEESDAAEITLPVLVRGARRAEHFSAVLRPGETRHTIRFTVPEERLAEQSRFEFTFSPGLAASLPEALPYLIDYPYGCTEQTLNRFLPALALRKHLGVLPNLSDAELDKLVSDGVERLAGMQNPDGGWGWFSGAGESSWPHATAVVVHGLAQAAELGAPLPAGLLDSGLNWIADYQTKQLALLEEKIEENPRKEKADDLDAFLHAILTNARRADPRMRTFLYRDRLDLSLTGLSMLGLALEKESRADELAMVLRNLSQFVETNPENQTARLRTPLRGWWLWQNDAVETQIWYLKLLTQTDPRSALASGVAKHLLQNRKYGAHWRSTRDTGSAVTALADYAAASGETAPDMTVKLSLDGRPVRERRLTKENMLDENIFALDGPAVETGDHELVIERGGDGPLYASGGLSVFSLEDPVPAAGGPDLRIARAFYKLTPAAAAAERRTSTGAAARVDVERYARTELPAESGTVEAGDLIEVELTVTAANDYEYLVFEDMKAAGLEAVEVRSGHDGNRMGAYIEYRDEKVVLFIRSLPQGEHTIAYRFRAEIPGAYSALPVSGGGMYATELFCNSDEAKIRIVEEGTFE